MTKEEKKLGVPLKAKRGMHGHGYKWFITAHNDKQVAQCDDEETANLLVYAANNCW